MPSARRSTVYRGVEILLHPADKKHAAQWSVSGGLLRPRIFFGSQGQAKRHIDQSKEGPKEELQRTARTEATVPASRSQPAAVQSLTPFDGRRLRGAKDIKKVFAAERAFATSAQLPRTQKVVAVPSVLRTEKLARGPMPPGFGVVPNKPGLGYERQVLYPEFVLVRLLEKRGWSAAWSKNWNGRAYWRAIGEDVRLPPFVQYVMAWLATQVTGRGGAWDIIAWQEPDRILFVESKQRGRDALRRNQREWLEAALECGLRLESFAIAEYVIKR